MINKGLFSKLYIDGLRQNQGLNDAAEGRMATLGQSWQHRNTGSLPEVWESFVKQALGFLGFVAQPSVNENGFVSLFEDWDFSNCICVAYLVDPQANIDDERLGRFWPGKLIAELQKKKLHWGILTNGPIWRLYSTQSSKPFEDFIELDLGITLESHNQIEYGLFETFFHAVSFIPERPEDDERDSQEREAGVYTCLLDGKQEQSEAILENKVKAPFLFQIDEVMQYICNGFISDTKKTGEDYTEEERRDIFESAVKLLYRCLFLFYAESRSLLPSEQAMEEAYGSRSIRALCREAHKFRWGIRTDNEEYDMWKHLKGLINAVNDGDPEYGIIGYNGGLFDDEREFFLGNHKLRNDFLARALYLLAYVEPADSVQKEEYAIPYEDLEVRHLGELYENILEFNVTLADEDRVRRRTKNGAEILLLSKTERKKGDTLIRKGEVFFGETALERKQSGSYYTPETLVRFLNEKAIVKPLQKRFAKQRERFNSFVEVAISDRDPATRRGSLQAAIAMVEHFIREEVLSYKVCDPAMGSGHFLVNAANQMTGFVISLLAELPLCEGVHSEMSCRPNYWRRLITRHCIYGVDLNPLSTHLAKLSLWLNCFARDHKLTFLDHHLRCGNSLIGVRTFDDVVNAPLKNKERQKKNPAQLPLPVPTGLDESLRQAAVTVAAISSVDEDNTDYQKESFDEAYSTAKKNIAALADLRTAFLMGNCITMEQYGQLYGQLVRRHGDPTFLDIELIELWQRVEQLRDKHHFFHWMLDFADIFAPGTRGGFDATVGNPPWDIVKPNSQEFFSTYLPEFRSLKKQQANKTSKRLMEENKGIQDNWDNYCNGFVEQSTYFRELEAFQVLGQGDINTFKLFLEQFFVLLKPGGHEGIVVPSGLYTDKGCQSLREMFFDRSAIDCLYGFENRWPTVFSAVDGRFKFVLFCTGKGQQTTEFKCAFMQHDPAKLPAIEAGALEMTVDQVRRFSPDTLSVMEFNNQQDVDVAANIFGDRPMLGEYFKETWSTKFKREFHVSDDNQLFISRNDIENLEDFFPVLEGKQFWILDHGIIPPKNYMTRESAKVKASTDYVRLVYRPLASNTNERTFVVSVIPKKLPTVNSLNICPLPEAKCVFFASILGSFLLDWIIRGKVTTNLNPFIVEQLPIITSDALESNDRKHALIEQALLARCCRLICTTDSFAQIWESCFSENWQNTDFWYNQNKHPIQYGPKHEQDIRKRLHDQALCLTRKWTLDCGVHERLPDGRDAGDRAQLRAEIDAYVAHLYGLSIHDFSYILDTFPVLERKEMSAFGEYMSKRKCLEEYERINKVLGAQEIGQLN